MKYSELYDKALRNSFVVVKKDINEIKAGNVLIDEKLKIAFFNIKSDMGYLKKSVEEIKAGEKKPIELDGNGRLSRIESAVETIKKDLSKDARKPDITRNLEDLDIDSIKSELKALDKARIESEHSFEKAIDSLKEELDIDSKFKKIEEKISKPAIKEIVMEKKAKAPKREGEKGAFTKMIDFFAED